MQFVVRDYAQMKRMAEELLPVERQPNVDSYFAPLEFWSKVACRSEIRSSNTVLNKRAGELFRELWTPPVFNDSNGDSSLSFNRVNMIAQHKCGTAYALSDYGAGNYDNRRERLRLYKLLKRVLFMYRSGELKGDFVVHKTRANNGPQNIAQWPVKMEAYGGYEYWFITGHIQWIMSMRQQLSLKNREMVPEFFDRWFKTNKVAKSKLHQLQKANEDERARFMNRVDYIRILKELFQPDIWSDYTIDIEMPRFGVLLYRNGKAYATFMGEYQTRHSINVNGNRKFNKFPPYLRRAMDVRMWKERVIRLEGIEKSESGLFERWAESLPNPADMWPEDTNDYQEDD